MLRKQAAPAREVQRSGVQPEHARRGPEIERWSGSVQTDERVLAAGPARRQGAEGILPEPGSVRARRAASRVR